MLFAGSRFVIGAHLAEALGRESFNLYASLNRRGIQLWTAKNQLVQLLCERGCVYLGTSCATLVKVDDVSEFAVYYLEEKREREARRKRLVKMVCLEDESEQEAIIRNLIQMREARNSPNGVLEGEEQRKQE